MRGASLCAGFEHKGTASHEQGGDVENGLWLPPPKGETNEIRGLPTWLTGSHREQNAHSLRLSLTRRRMIWLHRPCSERVPRKIPEVLRIELRRQGLTIRIGPMLPFLFRRVVS